MPQQNQSSDLATDWLGFTEDRRSALLQKMSPEQKATLRSAIESHSGAPQAILQERVKRLSLQNAKSPDAPKIEATPSLFSARGVKSAAMNIRERELESLSMIGGAVGGMVGAAATLPTLPTVAGPVAGAVAGATIGGSAGKSLETLLRSSYGEDVGSRLTRSTNLGWAGIEQGIYEVLGRAGFAVASKMAPIRKITEDALGEIIGGVKMPESSGQLAGPGARQQAEKYLSKSFTGGGLRKVIEAQEDATRKILGKLSYVPGANPAEVEANWLKARELTRSAADPMYDSLKEVAANQQTQDAAGAILDNPNIKLSPKASAALQKTSGRTAVKKSPGLRNVTGLDDLPAAERAKFKAQHPELFAKETSIGDAMQARSELRDLAHNSKDPNDRRLFHDAWQDLDSAINSSLNKDQIALKGRADELWHRSYIMDEAAQEFRKMAASQPPRSATKVGADAFVEMVNDLAHTGVRRDGGKLVTTGSKLDILFDSPADRKAVVDLAQFLSTKHKALAGSGGYADYVAKIGPLLALAGGATAAATGHEKAALGDAAGLAGLYLLSNALARPGGAGLLLQYFRSSGAGRTALVARVVGELAHQSTIEPPQEKPKTPGQMKRELREIQQRHAPQPSSNPFVR